MGTLQINEFGKDSREVQIPQEQVRIGRDPEGDVVLEDLGVSREHARILCREKDLLLEDLGSRNGTVINDKKLPSGGSYLLRHGDTIRVGRSLLKVLLRMSRKIATSLGLSPEPPAAEDARGDTPLCLFSLAKIEAIILVSGKGRGATRHVLRSDRVRIGRSASSDVVLDDPSVSADHAEIIYNREGFHLVDRDSAGGTFLDGVSVRVARMGHRSFIRFGKQKALFVLREERANAPEASFALRDHLSSLFPEKKSEIQSAFQECRFEGLDLAAELVVRGVLDPEEWWVATRELPAEDAKKASGWVSRLRHRLGR